MDARRLWNLIATGASGWFLMAATGATANTLDGDLTYARPDRGETIHRVPANNTGSPEAGPLSFTSAPAGGGGFSLPGNASVRHAGSGVAPLYEAVTGDRSYPAPAGLAPPTPPEAAPRRLARVTPPTSDPKEEEQQEIQETQGTQETGAPTNSGIQQANEIVAAITQPTEDGPLPFVEDQPAPNPEPTNALGPGGEQEVARQPLIAQVEIAAVPEPLGVGLLGAGLLGLGWLRRRAKV